LQNEDIIKQESWADRRRDRNNEKEVEEISCLKMVLFTILLILVAITVLIMLGIFWQVVLAGVLIAIIFLILKWLFGKLQGG
jgi:uncharacterized membrane protein